MFVVKDWDEYSDEFGVVAIFTNKTEAEDYAYRNGGTVEEFFNKEIGKGGVAKIKIDLAYKYFTLYFHAGEETPWRIEGTHKARADVKVNSHDHAVEICKAKMLALLAGEKLEGHHWDGELFSIWN